MVTSHSTMSVLLKKSSFNCYHPDPAVCFKLAQLGYKINTSQELNIKINKCGQLYQEHDDVCGVKNMQYVLVGTNKYMNKNIFDK